MSNFEFGVQYEDGKIFGETSDRDEIIAELLWAMAMREVLAAQDDWEAPRFNNPQIVIRDLDDEDPQAWAPMDVSEEELDAAREFSGEVD